MTSTWRVGVLGASAHASDRRIPSFLALRDEGVEVVAVADCDRELARRVARKRGIPHSFGSSREMLDSVELDGLVIVVPTEAHAKETLGALGRGVHVLCEKPMADSYETAQPMIEAAEAAGLVLGIGYQYQYMVGAAQAAIDAGELGTLQRVGARWVRRDGIPDRRSFWANTESRGAGLDLLGHLLSVALPMTGSRPVWVTARVWNEFGVERYGDRFLAEDTLDATVDFENGVRAHFLVAWAANVEREEEIGISFYGTSATLRVPLMGPPAARSRFRPTLVRRGRPGVRLEAPPTTVQCLHAQARNWVRACLGLERLRSTARHALAVQAVLDGAYESAALNGEQVELPVA